jgi:hypothetical protein
MRAYWMLVAVILGAIGAPLAFGQIQVPEHTPLGEPIIAAVQLPEGGKVAWKPANGFRFIESGKGELYIWAKPGRYEIEGALIALKDGQVEDFQFLKASFSVGDAPPVRPTTPAKTLRELVTAEQAVKLAKLHADFARLSRETPLSSDNFRKLYAEQLTALGLLNHGAKAEVGKRVIAVIGTDAKALDEPTRKALADALDKIAAEFGGAPAPDAPSPTVAATAAAYIYEKDATAIPSEVAAAINRLNRERKITATLFEQDSRDGDDEVPDQYKAALAAAKQAGLPALVVMAGETVLKVVKDPKTEAAVMEAVL